MPCFLLPHWLWNLSDTDNPEIKTPYQNKYIKITLKKSIFIAWHYHRLLLICGQTQGLKWLRPNMEQKCYLTHFVILRKTYLELGAASPTCFFGLYTHDAAVCLTGDAEIQLQTQHKYKSRLGTYLSLGPIILMSSDSCSTLST